MIRFSIRRPVAVGMLYAALALLGVASWLNVPVELLPETELSHRGDGAGLHAGRRGHGHGGVRPHDADHRPPARGRPPQRADGADFVVGTWSDELDLPHFRVYRREKPAA